MSLVNNCFMGILTCRKYKERRDLQDLSGSIFKYMYFIGDPSIDQPVVEDDIVILPCGDNYEDLPLKTKLMLKWIIDNNPGLEYIFKTDDDIRFNFNELLVNYKEIVSEKIDYCGNVVDTKGYISSYHFGKCESQIDTKAVLVEKAKYCSGGGYFLSKKAAQMIVDKDIDSDVIFEDHFVGKTLNDHNIFPRYIKLHNTSCFW